MEVERGVLEAGEDVFALLGVVVAEPRVQRVRPLLFLLLLLPLLLLPQPRARPHLSRRGRRRIAAGHGVRAREGARRTDPLDRLGVIGCEECVSVLNL